VASFCIDAVYLLLHYEVNIEISIEEGNAIQLARLGQHEEVVNMLTAKFAIDKAHTDLARHQPR
jgi:hypothetical protein